MANPGLGFLAAGISVLFFGSNFVPVKKFETGDGVFFQWIQCTAIWLLGLVVQLVQGSPPFQPLAMLGGVLWCTGNITVVPIVKMIGLSLGILVWGTVNLIAGWSSGNFGLFGITKETVPHEALNYVGVCFAVVSVVVMIGIKTDVSTKVEKTSSRRASELAYERVNDPLLANHTIAKDEGDSWVDKLTPAQRRITGLSMAVVSGVFYGVNFDPPTYLMDHYKDQGISQNGLDYVFSHFCGIYVTSTFYFLVYCCLKRNRPAVFPSAILPGFACGFLWAIAQISWFFANSQLSLVVSFPIISTGPGMVAALWGVFVFREIVGVRNYIVLICAFACTITAAVLTSLSTIA